MPPINCFDFFFFIRRSLRSMHLLVAPLHPQQSHLRCSQPASHWISSAACPVLQSSPHNPNQTKRKPWYAYQFIGIKYENQRQHSIVCDNNNQSRRNCQFETTNDRGNRHRHHCSTRKRYMNDKRHEWKRVRNGFSAVAVRSSSTPKSICAHRTWTRMPATTTAGVIIQPIIYVDTILTTMVA